MKRYAIIILASGNGSRFGTAVPKAYLPLFGKTILQHAIESLAPLGACSDIIVAFNPAHARYIKGHRQRYPDIAFIEGGKERSDSCLAAYRHVLAADSGSGYAGAFMHDAARPFPPLSMLDELRRAADEGASAACPALAVTDSLRDTGANASLCRQSLARTQTPQYLSIGAMQKIVAAYENGEFSDKDYTDDVSLAAKTGHDCVMTQGSERAAKLTHGDDWEKIAHIYHMSEKGLRLPESIVGHGYDVHRLIDDDSADKGVILGGIKVPYEKKLKGHSDADVVLHAITDAMFGALSMRDIGYHFSDTAPENKGKDSSFFVKYAHRFLEASGYRINNVDVTVICQQPVLFHHIISMTDNISAMLGGALVSVKATTTEKLGFEGRGEGIACQATVYAGKNLRAIC